MSDATFLGHGLLTPLRREGADFVHAGGDDLVRSCVENVLGTRAAGAYGDGGELPWRQEFGSRLHLLLHRNLGAVTDALARYYVEEALATWEPRVVVTGVDVDDDVAYNRRTVRIRYRLITKDRAGNRVTIPEAEAAVVL